VRSVVLVTRGMELDQIRTVALDTTSRTSSTLVRIIFSEFIGTSPQYFDSDPCILKMLDTHDAALIIGDPAMTFDREGLRVFDLASLWREYTGLGFVFAMWMMQENSSHAVDTEIFKRARHEGLENIDRIVADYSHVLNKSEAELKEYLSSISFTVDTEMREGLELYYRLAFRHGLTENLRQVKFNGS
jgi:chorismate dehydratase